MKLFKTKGAYVYGNVNNDNYGLGFIVNRYRKFPFGNWVFYIQFILLIWTFYLKIEKY